MESAISKRYNVNNWSCENLSLSLIVEGNWAVSTDWGLTAHTTGQFFKCCWSRLLSVPKKNNSVMQPRAPNKSGLFQSNLLYKYRSPCTLWTLLYRFLSFSLLDSVCLCMYVIYVGPSFVLTAQYKVRPREGHPAWVKTNTHAKHFLVYISVVFHIHNNYTAECVVWYILYLMFKDITATPVAYYGKTRHRIHMPIHELLFGLCPFFAQYHAVRNIRWKGVWAWWARLASRFVNILHCSQTYTRVHYSVFSWVLHLNPTLLYLFSILD